jgi:hypothetical protein
MEPLIRRPYVTYGADPEIFLERDGKIIGSEKVIPEEGVDAQYGRIVRDGVQAELITPYTSCRASFGYYIGALMTTLRDTAAETGFTPSFKAVVRIPPAELKSLSESSRVLGCMPSLNFYNPKATVPQTTRNKYIRSAGGHIHIGLVNTDIPVADRFKLVPLLDIWVGNTCVMMDREPLAAQRRKQYGRAGEYRLPAHGLEYRTLSNFWLRAYPLTSLVLGLCRLATSCAGRNPVLDTGGLQTGTWDAETDLLRRFNLKKVEKAINTNDIDLARENWAILKEFIQERLPNSIADAPGRDHIFPVDAGTLHYFQFFLDKIASDGLDYWFPSDPITAWTTPNYVGEGGWETFMFKVVKPRYEETQNAVQVPQV